MKSQSNTTQMKEQTRNTNRSPNKRRGNGQTTEKEFRVMIVKMIKNFEGKMEKM